MTIYTGALPHPMVRLWMVSAGRPQGPRYLRVNVRDDSEAFVLTAAVPGLKADGLKVSILEDVVRIEGQLSDDENDYLLRELPAGAFFRELHMPSPPEAEKVEARIEDGIFTLRLPKTESAKTKDIKVAVK